MNDQFLALLLLLGAPFLFGGLFWLGLGLGLERGAGLTQGERPSTRLRGEGVRGDKEIR